MGSFLGDSISRYIYIYMKLVSSGLPILDAASQCGVDVDLVRFNIKDCTTVANTRVDSGPGARTRTLYRLSCDPSTTSIVHRANAEAAVLRLFDAIDGHSLLDRCECVASQLDGMNTESVGRLVMRRLAYEPSATGVNVRALSAMHLKGCHL